ncbi:hypothetical protein T484DRAFT_3319667 [Baffinella frigidus]|nr:hypothetical protein T484DRAFT_3319667 [Cryptophyta sp. CCMP2293]
MKHCSAWQWLQLLTCGGGRGQMAPTVDRSRGSRPAACPRLVPHCRVYYYQAYGGVCRGGFRDPILSCFLGNNPRINAMQIPTCALAWTYPGKPIFL